MKRVLSIWATLATIAVALGFLNEDKPQISAGVSYEPGLKQWQVSGRVRFQRGIFLHILGWSSYCAVRTVPFELVIPDKNGKLSSETYEPRAILAARTAPPSWEVNYFTLLLSWLVFFFTFWLAWRVLRNLRHARGVKTGSDLTPSG